MARVLVTGAGGPAGTAVIEQLRTGPHRVIAADTEADTAGHRLADVCAQLPPGDDPSYGKAMLSLVAEHRIDVVLPTVAEELIALHAHSAELASLSCHTLVPAPETVRLCSDKHAFAELCARHGIAAPATTLPGGPLPPGPWVVKPRTGRGSRGISLPDSAEEARRLARELPDAVIQSRLPGREFTVDLLCGPGGTVVVSVPRWREQVRGGISTAGTAFCSPAVAGEVERLAKALDFRGVANVQGCQAEDGSFAFFEMNPRFSGGLPISIAAGADLVEAYLALAMGRPVPDGLTDWTPGRRVVRYLTQGPAPEPRRTPRPAGSSAAAARRRILVPLGTRPEIIKLAPVVRELSTAHDVRVVFTGQHTSAALGADMLQEFGITPGERWEAFSSGGSSGGSSGSASGGPSGGPSGGSSGGSSGGERLGRLVSEAARSLRRQRPDAVMVLGDTHTVPAFCLAAAESGVPLIHLEAGLRSYNPLSREEAHRRIAASLASLHLAPTARAAAALRAEGVPADRVEVVGNPGLDALRESGLSTVPANARTGVLLTAHRPTAVDDPERLREIVRIVGALVRDAGSVLFPVHPRTMDRLRAFGLLQELRATGADLRDPLPYAELLERMRFSRAVVTDSGGLQEEAAWLRVPAVVMRGSTPRWEGVEEGLARLSPVRCAAVRKAVAEVTEAAAVSRLLGRECPYGDGRTSVRVARLLGREDVWDRLRLSEPDFTDGRVPVV